MERHQSLISLMIFFLSFFVFNLNAQEQTDTQLFEKALYLEEAQGELQQAIDLYQQILMDNPDNRQIAAKALLHIGMCYEKLGLKQARKTYQDVINMYSEQTDEVALAKERVKYLEAYVADINRKAEQHLKEGNELFSRWEYESAIEEYKSAIELVPNTQLAQNARYYIGQSWFRAGRYDDALATFEKLIKEYPESNIAPVTELMNRR